MAVPVEEAIAALSTFSLEVTPMFKILVKFRNCGFLDHFDYKSVHISENLTRNDMTCCFFIFPFLDKLFSCKTITFSV